MALRGNLNDFTLPDVFQLIGLSKKTGVLRMCRADGSEGNVWFRDGEVFFAESNWHRERLGERLVTAQKITPSALTRVLQLRAGEPENGRRLGRILVDEGYITDAVLEAFVRDQVLEPIFDLMRWDEGEFDFEMTPVTPEEDIGLAVSIENIVMEGARRLEEWERIKKKVPSMDVVFKMATAPGEGTFEISLKPVEWNLLLLVDGTRSVAELARAAHWTEFDAARVVYGLHSAGLLDVVGEDELERLREERARREAFTAETAAAPKAPAPAPSTSAETPVAPTTESELEAAPAPSREGEHAEVAEVEEAVPELEVEPEPEYAVEAEAEVLEVETAVEAEAEPELEAEAETEVEAEPEAEAEAEAEPELEAEAEAEAEQPSAALVEPAESAEPDLESAESPVVEWPEAAELQTETISYVDGEPATVEVELEMRALEGGAESPGVSEPAVESVGQEEARAAIEAELAALGLIAAPAGEEAEPSEPLEEPLGAEEAGEPAAEEVVVEEPVEDATEAMPERAEEVPAAEPEVAVSFQEEAALLLETRGDLGLSTAITEEITALTGVERPTRPTVSDSSSQAAPVVPRRDESIDRETLLDIIEGIKRL